MIIINMRGLILTSSGHKLYKSPKDNPLNYSLRNNISTDEIYPVRYCFYYKRIGDYAMTGDRFRKISKGFVRQQKIKFIVAGENFGCGSAREHAAITLGQAGVRLIYAYSFNKTFRENCINNGIYTTTYVVVLKKYLSTNKIPKKLISQEFSGIEKEKLKFTNYFYFSRKKIDQQIKEQKLKKRLGRKPRPMTIAEKIIAQHLGKKSFVQPGDQFYGESDLRYSYEVFTPLIERILKRHHQKIDNLADPGSIFLFEDHFILSKNPTIKSLLAQQREFARKSGVKLITYGDEKSGICHVVLFENYLLPGQIVVGTDSHTSTGGVVNALSFGVGATEMANAFLTKYVFLKIPQTIRVNLKGKIPPRAMAKDVMLYFFAQSVVKKLETIGTVVEFGGEGLKNFSVDELAVLTNMSIEVGAWSGIVEPNRTLLEYLSQRRNISKKSLKNLFVYPDKEAGYKQIIEIDLAKLEPMIAFPSSHLNAIPLSTVNKKIKIDKAFIGSCTGGKLEDLRKAAKVIKSKRVKKGIELVVYPASMEILEQARKEGLDKIFLNAGGQLYPPVCGACAGQGPGTVKKGEVMISSSDRNYQGRMGAGEVYLANPMVVAASAVKGLISA